MLEFLRYTSFGLGTACIATSLPLATWIPLGALFVLVTGSLWLILAYASRTTPQES